MWREPKVADLELELSEVERAAAEQYPVLACNLRRRVALLRSAPSATGGVAWLAKCGDRSAKVAAEFYSGPPSGLRRCGG